MIFAGVLVTVVYFPVASGVFNLTSGMFATWGVIDFAGGHRGAHQRRAAGLALALVLGKRVRFAKGAHKPHNPPSCSSVQPSSGSAGSASTPLEGAADGIAALAWVNTLAAPAAAILGGSSSRSSRTQGHLRRCASGAVAGLVAITPACAALTPGWGILLGFLAGVVCCFAIDLKY